MFDFHFISGLPRSGSTLLAALLRQNPAFYSHIESPTGRLFTDMLGTLAYQSETGIMAGDEQRRSVLEAMMHGFYMPLALPEDTTIFDNNRKWCNQISALGQVFPKAAVFAMVRPVAEVVDSMERVYTANPLYANAMMRGRTNLTVYDRINLLLNPQEGVVGWSYNALRSAYYGPDRDRLTIIKYEDLARFPMAVLADIHAKVDADPFEYDFVNVRQIPGVDEFDRHICAPGMHRVHPIVSYMPNSPIIPPDTLQHLYKTYPNFWEKGS